MAGTPSVSELMNMPTIQSPWEDYLLELKWWTPEKAAERWGCSRATAYRLIQNHGEQLGRCVVRLRMEDGAERFLTVIEAHARMPSSGRRGNPGFRDSKYQSNIARSREKQRQTCKNAGKIVK